MPEGGIELELRLSGELRFHDHSLALVSVDKEASPFTDDHRERIDRVLRFFWSIDPAIVYEYTELRSATLPNAILYRRFPASGYNIYASDMRHLAILFSNRGMNTHLAHRVSPTPDTSGPAFINNFSGTLAHELAHGGYYGAKLFSDSHYNRSFIKEWQAQFGWKTIFPNVRNPKTNQWQKAVVPEAGWQRNTDGMWQRGSYVITGEHYTTMPERCIGGLNSYAASVDPYEDICDSVAAFAFDSPLLDPGKREFLHRKINEYKKAHI